MWKEKGSSYKPVVLDAKVPDEKVRSAIERCVRVKNLKTKGNPPYETNGTGVIIETGLIVTNWHVVEDDGIVTVNDHPAELIHFDFRYDLAAFKTKTRALRRIPMEFSTHRTMPVFYVGNPDEKNKSIAMGTITHRSKTEIRADVKGELGYSGSGLYDSSSGKLVGIVDSIPLDDRSAFTVAVPAAIVHQFIVETCWKR